MKHTQVKFVCKKKYSGPFLVKGATLVSCLNIHLLSKVVENHWISRRLGHASLIQFLSRFSFKLIKNLFFENNFKNRLLILFLIMGSTNCATSSSATTLIASKVSIPVAGISLSGSRKPCLKKFTFFKFYFSSPNF